MTSWTLKCPVCGDPYTVYDMYAGDQSACPACRSKARGGSLRERISRGMAILR
jgi:hypothetical protein